jgi:hypothetical protein
MLPQVLDFFKDVVGVGALIQPLFGLLGTPASLWN